MESNEYLRWAIWIDLEGFRDEWTQPKGMTETKCDPGCFTNSQWQVLRKLNTTAETIVEIGSHCFCGHPYSAHERFSDKAPYCRWCIPRKELNGFQLGDGFFLIAEPDFTDDPLPATVFAIALMRRLIECGIFVKIGIARGRFGDYRIKANEASENYNTPESNQVDIGSSILRLMPVMGTAWIKAYVAHSAASGPIISLDLDSFGCAANDFPFAYQESKNCLVIDWVHADVAAVDNVLADTKHDTTVTIEHLLNYLKSNPNLRTNWVESANNLIAGY